MTLPAAHRAEAEGLGRALPPLLAEAEHLSRALALGEHGRRRAGQGADFWQYRPAIPGDPLRAIDWRRSARSDQPFVREREWQGAQAVTFWVDQSRAMRFRGAPSRPAKADRAAVIALALAMTLLRAGERVGLEGQGRPQRGMAQIGAMAEALPGGDGGEGGPEYGTPSLDGAVRHGQAVLISDFLGDPGALRQAMAVAAERGMGGVLIQVLDPVEEEFPFDGRTLFQSPGGSAAFETHQAGALRGRYLARLAERKADLAEAARVVGWHFGTHHTGAPALPVLLWAQEAIRGAR